MDADEKNIAVDNFQKGLNTGIAELILLSVVSHAKQPMYGYQIAKVIEKENQKIPVIKLGTLYPFLRSLEKSGFLESHVDPSTVGPPRRYYQITVLGLETLEKLTESWDRTNNFVKNILARGEYDE
jgi:PadR family transcriptional regulator, regulatory protein PadR